MKGMCAKLEHILKLKTKVTDPTELMIKNINNALCEVFSARNNFNMAVGSDSIELAIYELSTAEIKYRNLLKEARRTGITRSDMPKLPEEADDN